MAGTIVVDRLESDASYASSINVASPLVVSNTISLGSAAAISGNVNIDNGLLFIDAVGNRVGMNTTTLASDSTLSISGNVKLNYTSSPNAVARIYALPSSTNPYVINSTGGAGILFQRTSGHDEIAFETHFSGNSHLERMRITKEGYVTKPYQPMFFAYRTSGSGNITTTEDIIHTVTDVNVGGHYNTSTGRFTAPISGTYMFIVEGMNHQSASSVGYTVMGLKKNGSQYGYFHIVNNHPSSCSKPFTMNLVAGDYVNCFGANYHFNGDTYRYPSFTGFLIG